MLIADARSVIARSAYDEDLILLGIAALATSSELAMTTYDYE